MEGPPRPKKYSFYSESPVFINNNASTYHESSAQTTPKDKSSAPLNFIHYLDADADRKQHELQTAEARSHAAKITHRRQAQRKGSRKGGPVDAVRESKDSFEQESRRLVGNDGSSTSRSNETAMLTALDLTSSSKHPQDVENSIQAVHESRIAFRGHARFSDSLNEQLLDPLKVLCPQLSQPFVRAIWRKAVNVFWPQEQHFPMPGQTPLPLSFVRHCMADELLFHCTTSALLSLDVARYGSKVPPATLLQCEAVALGQLRRAVAAKKPWSDELVFAVLDMTTGRLDPEVVDQRKPHGDFTPPSRDLQYLNTNGLLDWNWKHKKALSAALAARGGISTIAISGVAEMVQATDIVACSHDLLQPSYPLCTSYKALLTVETLALMHRRESRDLVALQLTEDEVGAELLRFINLMRAYLEVLPTVPELHGSVLRLARLATRRNTIQYQLLSRALLDLQYPLNPITCLGLHIFTYGAIYPLPDQRPLQQLAQQLRTALQPVLQEFKRDFLTWLLALGGIATAGLPDRVWFVEQLALLYDDFVDFDPELVFNRVVTRLHGFIWSDVACNNGLVELWSEVESLMPDSERG